MSLGTYLTNTQILQTLVF